MVIRILLIFALQVTILYALRNRRQSPLVSMGALLFGLVGIFCVVMPDVTTMVAHLLGVGRGTDLLLYCFIISSVLMLFSLHLRVLRLQDMLTAMVRELALAKAHKPEIQEPATIGRDLS